MKRINKILWHGVDIPIPSSYEGSLDGLNRGELFIYEEDSDPSIFIKTSANNVKKISGGVTEQELNEMLASVVASMNNKLSYYATQEWVTDKGYAVATDVASTYATIKALNALSGSVVALKTDFDNLSALLNDDVQGKINTWHEVVDFLDEYSGSQDLATILSTMNADIASRLEKTKFAEYFSNEMAKWFVKDDTNKGIKPVNSYGLYSDTYVSAKGVSTGTGGSGGGGTSYDRLDLWAEYTSDKAGYVLSALLGYDLHTRVNNLASAGYITASALSGYAKLSDIPTSLPASDVYSWAKAANKPSYAFSEITGKPTTLGGYGIVDTYTATAIDSKLSGYLPLSGGILSDYWSGGTQIRRKDENNGYVNLAFSQFDGTILGGLGFGGANNPIFINSAGDAYLSLIHSGNIGSQSVASAAKLTTPRSIWGQSFDGTGDVSGHLTEVSSLRFNGDIGIWQGNIWSSLNTDDIAYYATRHAFWGNVGIGTTSPSEKLHVAGNIVATGSVTAKSSSDYRLKCDFDYGVDYQERLLSLGRVCDFNYTPYAQEREFAFADDKRHTSVIWQDARKANITGFCSVEEDGYGTINPLSSDLIFTMVGAIQQGITKTEKIEDKVVRLEKENEALRKEINDMKGGRYGC